jgi:hypothetical protein
VWGSLLLLLVLVHAVAVLYLCLDVSLHAGFALLCLATCFAPL